MTKYELKWQAQVVDLEKKNKWLTEKLKEADALNFYFASKIDAAHTECVLADARQAIKANS